ncbi:MAG: ribonuclease R [Ruminococcus sp.]|jgi:ribonuclease R|nr:ribonuclease R [Ruminococcus sp.]
MSKHQNRKKHGTTIAVMSEICGTFGYAETDEERFFIPGHSLCGAMPGDTVALALLPKTERSGRFKTKEAEITEVVEYTDRLFTGIIENCGGYAYIKPDCMPRERIAVIHSSGDIFEGDKVLFEVTARGAKHSEHRAEITENFGDSALADSAARAAIKLHGIETVFPKKVIKEAEAAALSGISEEEAAKRLDLRERIIFTIDGADTKDIDDAVSVKRREDGFELGVHIADVSYYVKPDSFIDKNAFMRGTSVYYADKVIPMLPEQLSNGICSLNPNEDRLAFSCLMRIDFDGKIQLFTFRKTLINSKVKGVYSEINEIIKAQNDEKPLPENLAKKYSGLTDTIALMYELSEVLRKSRTKRGPDFSSTETKFTIDPEGICVGMKRRETGIAEAMIEQFMLAANNCAAKLAKEKKLPFVYRIHDKPETEKLESLYEFLLKCGIEPPIRAIPKPRELRDVLEKAQTHPAYKAVSAMMLRSMAKARYADEYIGHYGLGMADYAHFTSPIRRYPDLAVHRILSDEADGMPIERIIKRYAGYCKAVSKQATEREIAAVRAERECEDYYSAEFMKNQIGESFDAVISGVLRSGFFAELENTAEGFVPVITLPDPPYEYDGFMTLHNNTGRKFTLGDKVRVMCAASDVASARIDFVLEEDGLI